MGLTIDWDKYNKVLQEDLFKVRGRVVNVVGLTTESKGPQAKLGDICLISSRNGGTEEKPEAVKGKNRPVATNFQFLKISYAADLFCNLV